MIIDVASEQFKSNPYPLYEAARQARVCSVAPFDAYAVTRYADVDAALKDYRRFSSEAMATFFASRSPTGQAPLGRSLVTLDPPRHFDLRRVAAELFQPQVLGDVESEAARFAETVLNEQGGNAFDVVGLLAAPLALRTISRLLGIEPEFIDAFKQWTDDITGPEPDKSVASRDEMRAYLRNRIDVIRQKPDRTWISRLIEAENGGRLQPDDVLDLAQFLLFAGNKTTRHFLGNAVLALANNPAVHEQVRVDAGLLPGLVQELLRYDSPSQIALRTATEDIALGEQRIPAGATVFLLLGSADHDEDRFPEPETIDPRRDASGHLGLGSGTHRCLGNKVAQLQAQGALGAIIRRAERIQVEDWSLDYYPPMFLRGLRSLTCRLTR